MVFPKTSTHRRRQDGLRVVPAGFTLVELLVSTAIGMFILAGLIAVLTANYRSSRANDQTSELVANGSQALNALKRDIRQAGFRGRTWGESTISDGGVALASGCAGAEPGASASAFATNMGQGVWGANNSNPFPGNCISPDDYVPGTDVLVIRYVTALATTAPAAGTLYWHSSYGRGELFRGLVPPTDPMGVNDAADFAVQIRVYHVRPYTRSPDENPRSPALVKSSLQSDGTMQVELVTSGIEQFQVQYGRQESDANTQYIDTMAGDSSTRTPTEWDDVHAMRIWLLARSAAPEAGYSSRAAYVMGDQTAVSPIDGYYRRLFSSVVQLRN